MSSHNMPEVEQLCDFVVMLSYGRVVAMGRPKELVARYACTDLDEGIHLVWGPQRSLTAPRLSSPAHTRRRVRLEVAAVAP